MASPFENFSLDAFEQWRKIFCKTTGRQAGQPAKILKYSGRVEKILIGSIFDRNAQCLQSKKNWLG